MINLYATPTEIKSQLGDGISQDITKYDPALIKMIGAVSRLIDDITGRLFYPSYGYRYYDGSGNTRLWIEDCIDLIDLQYSVDSGLSYTAYGSGDYLKTRAGDINSPASYNLLVGSLSGVNPVFYPGQRSIKVSGWWAYHENRLAAWEKADQLDAQLLAGASQATVKSAGGFDLFGINPRFQQGQIIKIENEIMIVALVDPADNKLNLIRGQNGSVDATHAKDTNIYVWKPAQLVSQACVMQAVRTLNRAWQGFADARATPDLGGQVMWVKKLDPEVIAYLGSLARLD